MKIAVLYTGEYRTPSLTNFDNFISNIRNLLDEFSEDEIDIFLTTWYKPNQDIAFNNFKIVDCETQSKYINDILNYEEYEKFLCNYNNKDPIYNKWSPVEEMQRVSLWLHAKRLVNNLKKGKTNAKLVREIMVAAKMGGPDPDGNARLFYIYYKLHRGLNIIKKYSEVNNINYDLIIKTRTDISLYGKLSKNYISSLKDDGVYIKQVNYEKIANSRPDLSGYSLYANGWLDDSFFYFKPTQLDNVKNIHNEYYNICVKNNTWITHVVFNKFFEKHNIKTYDHHIDMHIHRSNGSWFQPIFYSS